MRAKFIYEKFLETSDPISDMRIGEKLAHLKQGDTLQSNIVNLYLFPTLKTTRNKYKLGFKGTNWRYKMPYDFYYVLLNVKYVKPNKIYFEAIPFGEVYRCIKIKSELDNMTHDIDYYKSRYEWFYTPILTISRLKKYFRVYQS